MLRDRIIAIVKEQAGIPDAIKEALTERILQAVEQSKFPEGRKEGVTVMTEAASLAADRHIKNKMYSPHDPKPKTL